MDSAPPSWRRGHGAPIKSLSSYSKKKKGATICRNYLIFGACSYGNRCRYANTHNNRCTHDNKNFINTEGYTCRYRYERYCRTQDCKLIHQEYKGLDTMVYCGETVDFHYRTAINKIYTSDGEFFYDLSKDHIELLFYKGMNPISSCDSFWIRESGKWFKECLELYKKTLLLTSIFPEELVRIITLKLIQDIKYVRLLNTSLYNYETFKTRKWNYNWNRKEESDDEC